ncbi:MAG: trypsin-like serine protease [Gammaproteobacteria bacterium]|nr:trypsin-like serine protease [Gammaproteobacteria bacterium]NIW94666.1 trypsin-like serine protease [Phycisphaerae bacterium]
MRQLTALQSELWRRRLQRLRTLARSGVPFAAGVSAAFAALLLYNVLVPAPPQLTAGEVNDSIAQALASATPPPAYSALVYQAIRPSLVFIETEAPDENGETGHGVGSGVVIDDRGDILTSLHVIANASDIQLIFADGTQSSAQVIAEQPENDIAVLRPNQPPALIVPAILGNPNAMRVGDEAFVVGNPLGLYGSMTAGVISGFDRSFKPPDSDQRLHNLIQIDAAVNPGNSGGPLLNRHGQVIGIVTALANPTEQDFFIGIGFAVPITIAGGAAGLPPY